MQKDQDVMKVGLRNYQSGDLDKYSRNYPGNEAFEREARWLSPGSVREFLFSPGLRPEKDAWVAENSEGIVGLAYLVPEREIDRAVLKGVVHPRYRRTGIGRDLLDRALKRAAELEISVIQTDIDEKNEKARGFLEANHFRKVRVFHEMRLLIKEQVEEITGRGNISIEQLKQGEEDLLTAIQNLCFQGSWGYNPNKEVEVKYDLGLEKCSHDDVLIARIKDRPAGFCWLIINPETFTTYGLNRGRIHMMGVVPDYRGTGIGKRLLVSALSHLKQKDINVVELTVDSENKAAFELYSSAGFRVYSNTHWYERPVSAV